MSTTVQIMALRTVVVGPGRSMAAGEIGVVDALTAAVLVQQMAAELVHDRDAPKLRQALIDDVDRQQGHRRERETGSPWQPVPIH
jgi:hypothetical protein